MNSSLPMNETPRPAEAGSGLIPFLLRAEAVIELVTALWAYRQFGGTWPLFAAWFLAPDISMAGYLANRRLGAQLYNLGHCYVAPALLVLLGFLSGTPLLNSLALIWAAHIGFDRSIGYGLKYPSSFHLTHLHWNAAETAGRDRKS